MQEQIVENQSLKSQNKMQEQTSENQTRIFLFDLMNTAKEFGFKADDNWELTMVTETERTKIQKDYYPTIATKVNPDILLEVFQAIKSQLNQSLKPEEQLLDKRSIVANNLKHLVAFIPTRPRN